MDVFGLEPIHTTIVISIVGVLLQVGQDIKFEDFGDDLNGLFFFGLILYLGKLNFI